MATEQYLEITNGTDTVTIADGSGGPTSYKLIYATWAPQVAGKRGSELDAGGPYAEVDEVMQLIVSGSTVPDVLANVEKLNRLLDEAEDWARGDSATPVLIKYSPKGATVSSAASPLQAVVLGRSPSVANGPLQLPTVFSDLDGNNLYVLDVTISFRRRGQWIGADESAGPATAGPAGDVTSVSFGTTHKTRSPVTIQFTGFASQAVPYDAFLILAANSGDIEVVEAEDLVGTSANGYSEVNDGNGQRGAGVLRYTPADTNYNISPSTMTLSMRPKRVAVYAVMRPNSVSVAFNVQMWLGIDLSGLNMVSLPVKQIYNWGATEPRVVALGIASSPVPFASFYLMTQAMTVSSSLDIDYFVFVNLDNPHSQVLGLDAFVMGGGGAMRLYIKDNVLSELTPFVGSTDAAAETTKVPTGYRGSPYLTAYGQNLYACLVMTGGSGAGNRWRYTEGGAVDNLQLSATRRKAYLTPQ